MLNTRESIGEDRKLFESMARQADVSIDEVALLYVREKAELEARARVKAFLTVLAIRNVRRMLQER
jgi:Protein of unknown function (DUF3562)